MATKASNTMVLVAHAYAGSIKGSNVMHPRSRWRLLNAIAGMIAAALPCGLLPAASATPITDEVAARCSAQVKAADWPGALLSCSEAIEKDPKLIPAWINRCQAQLELAQLDQAMADCRQAIQLDPGNSEAYLRLADVKAATTPVDYPSVLQDYDKAIILDPRNATAYNNRGVTRNLLKNYRGALDDYNKAIEINPNDPLYYFNRGETLFLLGERERGCSSFRQGHDLNPTFTLKAPDFDAAYLKACNRSQQQIRVP
jgi:tetratricopeptide (TPR) repeat protein